MDWIGIWHSIKRRKATIGFLVLFFALFFSSRRIAAQLTTVRVLPETQATHVGDEAAVAVEVVEVSGLYGFQLDLTYDPSILHYVSWEKGTFIGNADSTFWIAPDTSTPGVIKNIAATRTTPGVTVSATGSLMTVTFVAIAEGSSTIGVANLVLADHEAIEIPSVAQDGEIKVESFIYLPCVMKSYSL